MAEFRRVDVIPGGGGDYTSLNAALAGEDDTYADLTAQAGWLTFACWAGSGADTTAAATGTGWTTDATHYLNIIGEETECVTGTTGKWSTSRYRLAPSFSYNQAFLNSEPFTRLVNLQIQNTSHDRPICVYSPDFASVGTFTLDGCICRGDPLGESLSTSYPVLRLIGDRNQIVVRNTVVYGHSAAGGVGITTGNYLGSGTFHNVTVYDCETGWSGGYATRVNCGTAGCSTPSSGSYTDTTCSTDTPTFLDADNGDFHLASGDATWRDQGTDLSATFTTDIDGETRPTGAGTWDIGADEYIVAAGGLPIPVAMYHYLHH